MGYHHIAEFGQKGYHGVAIISRLPFVSAVDVRRFCAKDDCRHICGGGRDPAEAGDHP